MCYGQGGARTIVTTLYWQRSQKQRTDPDEIKRALMTAYAMDAFSAFDEFTAQRLRQNETVDEF